METSTKKYSVKTFYSEQGKEFKEIIKSYIENKIKSQSDYWLFQNNDIKYK